MARTCEQRAARVPQPACREPFLSCCKFAEKLRRNQARSQGGLARGEQPGEAEGWVVMPERAKHSLTDTPPPPAQDVLQEEDLIDEDDVLVRSFFPENWLWKVEPVDRSKV